MLDRKTEIEMLRLLAQRNKDLIIEVAALKLLVSRADSEIKRRDQEIKRLSELLELETAFNRS